MIVRPIKLEDKLWIKNLIIKEWESIKIISRGKIHKIENLQGLIAEEAGDKQGIITYHVEKNECEIITLNAIYKNKGIGTMLLQELIKQARKNNWNRIWCITTNNNTDALRFYQKKGFVLKAIYPNAIEESRKLKPEIPKVDNNRIPIRDEIELEYLLI